MNQLDQLNKTTRQYINYLIQKMWEQSHEEDRDDFNDWVHETRAAAGLPVPPESSGGGSHQYSGGIKITELAVWSERADESSRADLDSSGKSVVD